MEITLTFEKPFNKSLQVGDTIWYARTLSSGGYNVSKKEEVRKLGTVEFISNQYRAHELKVSHYHTPGNVPSLGVDASTFIMFSKNDVVNLSDLKGYYAEVKLNNNSKEKIELFSVGSEISESSK